MGNWKGLRGLWRTSSQGMIFNTVQNAKKLHPAGSENSIKAHFEAKIAEKLSNTANPSVPLSM